jgi:hypothetical protein
MKSKRFNCVEMMHEGAARVQKITENMTLEEELAFWAERTRELERRVEVAKRKQAQSQRVG